MMLQWWDLHLIKSLCLLRADKSNKSPDHHTDYPVYHCALSWHDRNERFGKIKGTARRSQIQRTSLKQGG